MRVDYIWTLTMMAGASLRCSSLQPQRRGNETSTSTPIFYYDGMRQKANKASPVKTYIILAFLEGWARYRTTQTVAIARVSVHVTRPSVFLEGLIVIVLLSVVLPEF